MQRGRASTREALAEVIPSHVNGSRTALDKRSS